MNPSCANSHMVAPCRMLTFETSSHVYIKMPVNLHLPYDKYLYMNYIFANLHMYLPYCQCTLWRSLYTAHFWYIYIHMCVCLCHSIDTRVRVWTSDGEIRIWFALASVHTSKPRLYTSPFLEVYIFSIIDAFVYETDVVQTYVCLCFASPHI